MKTGVELIAEERQRQIAEEGWTENHDSKQTDNSLSMAAALYAAPVNLYGKRKNWNGEDIFIDPWPWKTKMDDVVELNAWDKRSKHSRMRRLIIAGALIAAEIDRINRQPSAPQYPWHHTEDDLRQKK